MSQCGLHNQCIGYVNGWIHSDLLRGCNCDQVLSLLGLGSA